MLERIVGCLLSTDALEGVYRCRTCTRDMFLIYVDVHVSVHSPLHIRMLYWDSEESLEIPVLTRLTNSNA